MKNKNNKKTFGLILIAISIILIFIYLISGSPSSTDQSGDPKNDISQNEIPKLFSGTLYYLKNHDNSNYIYKITNDLEEKLIYTDETESNKLKNIAGTTNDGKIYIYTGSLDNIYQGSLYYIHEYNLNHVDANFSTAQPPLISPNGTDIAYVSFSNAQFEYGFTLYLMNIENENKYKIDTSDKSIPTFSFNINADKIAYVKDNQIYIYDFSKSKSEKISDIDKNQPIVDIYWSTENKILIHAKDIEKEISYIYNLNTSNKKKKLIYTSYDNPIISKVIWANNNNESFFAIIQDQIYLINNNEVKSLNDKKANYLISWLP